MAEKENRLAQQGRRAKPGPYITKKKKQKLLESMTNIFAIVQ